MTKYKRWILLLTALTVFVVNVESLRATSLIHAGKFSKLVNTTTSTSSTTSTEGTPNEKPKDVAQEEVADEELYVEVNGTKIALTGIPQIDYVWDPNLPRELNGFNLSTYPFLDSMPEEEDIAFDCEDKINGFYASIKFGCQLYHHCLYGVRSDFICANFTAFDQKTFICHFASEVDCKNSYKYWNRNDDLYKATTEKSTTSASGLVPLIDRNLYKRPLPGLSAGGTKKNSSPPGQQPQRTVDSLGDPPKSGGTNDPLPPARNVDDFANAGNQRQPNRPLRRPPYRRRRPQVDYYYYDDEYEEDFYDERGRRRQQRPRNRRPIYDDYDSRRPYGDRDSRRPYNDDFDDYEYERRPYRNRNRSESRRNGDDRRNDDRRFNDRRRPYNDDRRAGDDRRVNDDRRRPAEDERRSYDDRRVTDDRKNSYDDRKKFDDDRKKFDDDRIPSEDRKINRRKNAEEPVDEKGKDRFESKQAAEESANDDKLVKPAVSLFDRPRVPPKISRPVPLNEKNKFSYKTVDESKKNDESYEDEYEDEAPLSSSTTTTTTTTSTTTTTQKPTTTTTRYSPRRQTSTTTKKPTTTEIPEIEYYDDEYDDSVPPPSSTTPKFTGIDRSLFFNRNANKIEKTVEVQTPAPVVKPSIAETFKLNRFKNQNFEPAVVTTKLAEETTTAQISSRKPLPSYGGKKNQQTQFDTTTIETTRAVPNEFAIDTRFNSRESEFAEDPRMVVRVIKRPFLPSRGGNPYKARGLQPVGPASLTEVDNSAPESAPSAPDTAPSAPETLPPSPASFEKTSATPNIHKTTLDDIYNEEYDVELNDALNPNLKPLTSSRGISGFSFSSLNDNRDGYRSQSVKNIQRAEAPKTSTTTTTTEAPLYEYYDDDDYANK